MALEFEYLIFEKLFNNEKETMLFTAQRVKLLP